MNSLEPLGVRAVRAGFVRADQIDEALERQRQRRTTGKQHRLLGLLLVDQGYLSPDQLVRLLDNVDRSPIPLTTEAITLAVRLSRSLDESDTAIVFAGVTDGDAADQVAMQVALAFAGMQQGHVLVLDAHIRQASVHRHFGGQQVPGFSDVLAGVCSADEAIFASAVPNLYVLPAGSSQHDVTKLLLAESGEGLIKQLRAKYLLIAIHSPPLLEAPEGSLLAVRADAVVTVLATGRRTKDQVLEIKRTLDALKARSLGVVLMEKGRTVRRHLTEPRPSGSGLPAVDQNVRRADRAS